MSSPHPEPNAKFIENRVNNIAQRAINVIAQGNPFSVKIVMPQNVDGVYNGLVAKLSSHTVVLNATTSEITISNKTSS